MCVSRYTIHVFHYLRNAFMILVSGCSSEGTLGCSGAEAGFVLSGGKQKLIFRPGCSGDELPGRRVLYEVRRHYVRMLPVSSWTYSLPIVFSGQYNS